MQVNLFEGTCYLTPLLGAWLADARWGRYKTILVFSAIYFLVSRYNAHASAAGVLRTTSLASLAKLSTARCALLSFSWTPMLCRL